MTYVIKHVSGLYYDGKSWSEGKKLYTADDLPTQFEATMLQTKRQYKLMGDTRNNNRRYHIDTPDGLSPTAVAYVVRIT